MDVKMLGYAKLLVICLVFQLCCAQETPKGFSCFSCKFRLEANSSDSYEVDSSYGEPGCVNPSSNSTVNITGCSTKCYTKFDSNTSVVTRGCYTGEQGITPDFHGCQNSPDDKVWCFCNSHSSPPGIPCNTENTESYYSANIFSQGQTFGSHGDDSYNNGYQGSSRNFHSNRGDAANKYDSRYNSPSYPRTDYNERGPVVHGPSSHSYRRPHHMYAPASYNERPEEYPNNARGYQNGPQTQYGQYPQDRPSPHYGSQTSGMSSQRYPDDGTDSLNNKERDDSRNFYYNKAVNFFQDRHNGSQTNYSNTNGTQANSSYSFTDSTHHADSSKSNEFGYNRYAQKYPSNGQIGGGLFNRSMINDTAYPTQNSGGLPYKYPQHRTLSTLNGNYRPPQSNYYPRSRPFRNDNGPNVPIRNPVPKYKNHPNHPYPNYPPPPPMPMRTNYPPPYPFIYPMYPIPYTPTYGFYPMPYHPYPYPPPPNANAYHYPQQQYRQPSPYSRDRPYRSGPTPQYNTARRPSLSPPRSSNFYQSDIPPPRPSPQSYTNYESDMGTGSFPKADVSPKAKVSKSLMSIYTNLQKQDQGQKAPSSGNSEASKSISTSSVFVSGQESPAKSSENVNQGVKKEEAPIDKTKEAMYQEDVFYEDYIYEDEIESGATQM